MASSEDYAKHALKTVALDRQLAGAIRSALRSWSRTKKATGRTYKALAFAAALEAAENETKVARSKGRKR